ncbi:uncharacterized protein KRP23_13464 [Phytophthora ramorum]|uniref:uncharacterized protein n=1 Tax=Phytophthora ramorum TaxID=164328 RepID=UPI0030AA4053|nr:hypothetical protein KRP23_13464 [Phytophthora ramorum]
MSLPTNGGTDRDAVSALPALSFSSLSRPLSYSISRSQIVSSAHGLSRKRSHSGDSPPLPPVSSSRVAFASPRVSFFPPPFTAAMVFKFCSPPWVEEPPAAPPPSNHDSEDDRSTEGQRSCAERAWDDLLVAAFRAKQSEDPNRWEKEFSVFFDDSKPVGLGFQPASKCNRFSLVPTESYACVVHDVAPVGLAADYNARCRAAGDYSRIIVDKLRVRMVNEHDVANIAYADVLQMMRDAKPALTLTLADINSGLVNTTGNLEERSKSLGNLSLAKQPRRRSSLSMGPGKLSSRHNSHCSLEIKSDCLQLPETTNEAGCSDVVVSNLKAEYLEVSQQLCSVREKLSALQQVREEDVRREQEIAARQLETLLQETRKVQRERDDMVAVNKLLLRHKRASTSTLAELEAVKTEQVQLQRHQEELEKTLEDLQAQLAEQTVATNESREQANELRHDKEMLALQWQELQEEHRDTQKQVDELHDRLVDAQRAHRAVEVVLAALRTAHAAKTHQVRELQAALEVANSRTTVEEEDPPVTAEIPVAVQPVQSVQQSPTLPPPDQPNSAATTVPLHDRLKDGNFDLNQNRDELLAEFSCHEQQLQQLQEQVHALELVNSTSKQLLASLHENLREAQTRERVMRSEFSAELEVVRKKVEQDAQTTQTDLKRQIRELEQRCENERTEKTHLQATIDELESASKSRAAAQAKEHEFLAQFKRQLESGIVVTKFGARGVPHQRVVYSDAQCHWLSWRSPATSVTHGSLMQPKADAKADTCDLVEVLPGATTETFARQRPDAPTRCLSLVFVHPCRTLDLQADTAAQCQQYLRGFRLLQEEAAHKRHHM